MCVIIIPSLYIHTCALHEVYNDTFDSHILCYRYWEWGVGLNGVPSIGADPFQMQDPISLD